VNGIFLSWRACIGLNILPQHYPLPSVKAVQTSSRPTQPEQAISDDLISEFPTVFEDCVKAMEGESFHIELTEEAKSFCVKTPRAIPYACREKLKAEPETLEAQGIITPVTHPTE